MATQTTTNDVKSTEERAQQPALEAKNKGKQEKKPFSHPANKKGKTLPGPSKKSTTETPLTNDPLWKDAFIIDGESGFVNEQSAKEFFPDAAGYVQLVEHEYKAISDVDKYYAKSIPASAHAYLHLIIYWYRIALIAQKRGTASLDQDKLVRFVQGYGSLEIAAGAADYLEGLGDFTDATGVKHLLTVEEPNNNGHFGRAAAETHGLYETLPAPAIFYRRVYEDLLSSTRGGQPSDDWVDEAIVPILPGVIDQQAAPPRNPAVRTRQQVRREREEGGADLDEEGGSEAPAPPVEVPVTQTQPTVNLLGWRPSTVLNANQTMEMRGALLDYDDVIINRYRVHRELFELVERRLRECKRYKLSKVPTTTGGSIAQQVTWKPTEYTRSKFQQLIELPGVAGSRTCLPVRIAIASKVMCYRAIRAELDDEYGTSHNTWACFRFPDSIPANWVSNRNTRIHVGTTGMINYMPFKTQVTPRADTLQEYIPT